MDTSDKGLESFQNNYTKLMKDLKIKRKQIKVGRLNEKLAFDFVSTDFLVPLKWSNKLY